MKKKIRIIKLIHAITCIAGLITAMSVSDTENFDARDGVVSFVIVMLVAVSYSALAVYGDYVDLLTRKD